MRTIVDSFDELTELFFKGMRDDENFRLYTVTLNYNSRPGQANQLQFVLYPERAGFVEDKATGENYIALKKKADVFKKLMSSLGVDVQYIDVKDKMACKICPAFPAGPAVPAWALYGEIPDTEEVIRAFDAESATFAGIKPDEKGARVRLREKVEEKPIVLEKNYH